MIHNATSQCHYITIWFSVQDLAHVRSFSLLLYEEGVSGSGLVEASSFQARFREDCTQVGSYVSRCVSSAA